MFLAAKYCEIYEYTGSLQTRFLWYNRGRKPSTTIRGTSMYSVTLKRIMPQFPKTSVTDQINHILGVALRGVRGEQWGWQCINKETKADKKGGSWVGVVTLYFEKTRGRRNDGDTVEKQWSKIMEMIAKAGSSTKYNKYPWAIIEDDATDDPEETKEVLEEEQVYDPHFDETPMIESEGNSKKIKGIKREVPPGVHDVCVPTKVLTLDDLRIKFPHELMNGTDEQIEMHEAFKGIYGRGPQIRSVLSSIWSFVESKGERANHTLLWGLPACAKTAILLGLIKLFGEGAVLRLDSTSTTRAGLEKLIFKELEFVPPIFVSEEIEKADEQALRIWLGAMDDRHEFRKVNFHMHQVRKVYFLSLATANDKEKFDLMMGGRPGSPGALSSRFVHQWECPRPNQTQMRMILKRDIERFGGNHEWIDPCLDLAKRIGTDDPRKVLGFLDGGNRLLNVSYQNDLLLMHKKEPMPEPVAPPSAMESMASLPITLPVQS